MEQQDTLPLSPEMIQRIQDAVMAIATAGWGEVRIIVERGQPKRLLEIRSERLAK
jgi:hypothetical protein